MDSSSNAHAIHTVKSVSLRVLWCSRDGIAIILVLVQQPGIPNLVISLRFMMPTYMISYLYMKFFSILHSYEALALLKTKPR